MLSRGVYVMSDYVCMVSLVCGIASSLVAEVLCGALRRVDVRRRNMTLMACKCVRKGRLVKAASQPFGGLACMASCLMAVRQHCGNFFDFIIIVFDFFHCFFEFHFILNWYYPL